jgi:putative redox protein
VELDIQVPPTFPERYLQGVMHAANHCAVKKAILNPPEFEVRTQVTDPVRLPL